MIGIDFVEQTLNFANTPLSPSPTWLCAGHHLHNLVGAGLETRDRQQDGSNPCARGGWAIEVTR